MMRYFFSLALLTLLVGGGAVMVQGRTGEGTLVYRATDILNTSTSSISTSTTLAMDGKDAIIVRHLDTPDPLRGIYMTSCVAGDKAWRESLVKFIGDTELNALVIDIKDYTGKISFDTGDPRFIVNSKGCSVKDMKAFIAELHDKGIYVIGRVTVMQDATYPAAHADDAVKRKSTDAIWKDKKGLTYVDPGATGYWDHMVDLAKDAYATGFDEINFDYIRYPSDGDMKDIRFPRSGTSTKSAMMRAFYSYLGGQMHAAGIKSSADLFGMTTTNTDDLNIGQIIEHALLAFDYVAPMVYPSHYPPMFNGWKDPNLVPGEVVKYSMEHAVLRARALEKEVAVEEGKYPAHPGTTTPPFAPTGTFVKKLRPWLQDFQYGGHYGEKEVRAQMQAVYDTGLTSWMVWDPANRYTRSAFDIKSMGD